MLSDNLTVEQDIITPEQCELTRLYLERPSQSDEDYESLGRIFDDDFDGDE